MDPRQFFTNHLVPAGQAAEVAVSFIKAFPPKKDHLNDVIQEVREPLNLMAAYVTHAKVNNLPEIVSILDDYVQVVAKKMNALKRVTSGSYLQAALHRCLTGELPSGAANSRNRKHFEAVTKELVECLNHFAINRLYPAIGYTSLDRLGWLQKHSTALTHPGSWQTFVRNSQWATIASRLGYQGLAPLTEVRIGSRVGRSQLQVALAYVTRWMATDLSEVTTAPPAEAAQPQDKTVAPDESSKLPFYLEVRSTKGGLLEVVATYAPAHMLSSEQRQKAKEIGLLVAPKEENKVKLVASQLALKKAAELAQAKQNVSEKAALAYGFPILATVTETMTVPWVELASAVEHCQRWYESRPDSQAVREAFDRAVQTKALQDVKAKLVKTFSAEERAALKALLLEEGHLPAA